MKVVPPRGYSFSRSYPKSDSAANRGLMRTITANTARSSRQLGEAQARHEAQRIRVADAIAGLHLVTRPEIEHQVDVLDSLNPAQRQLARMRRFQRFATDGPPNSFKLSEYMHGVPNHDREAHNYVSTERFKGWVLPYIVNAPYGKLPYPRHTTIPRQDRHDILVVEKDGSRSWGGGVLAHRAPDAAGHLPQRGVAVGHQIGGFFNLGDQALGNLTDIEAGDHPTQVNEKTSILSSVEKAIIELGGDAVLLTLQQQQPGLVIPPNGPNPPFAESWREIKPLSETSR